MNNEEKTKKLVCDKGCTGTYCEKYREKCDVFNAVMEMAEWKDKQFQEEKKKWLDKAYMWIEYKYIKNSGGYYSMYRKENIIKSFKQAMEE